MTLMAVHPEATPRWATGEPGNASFLCGAVAYLKDHRVDVPTDRDELEAWLDD